MGGFPVSSAGDFAAVQMFASEIKGPIIAGLARCVTKEYEAGRPPRNRGQARAHPRFSRHV